ncbi:MAG: hypothetical protein FWG47_01245 [Propionibacteriaceae bacterium]|nr:hypothetical protein [Propionibacteriaceae bacterium]
MFSLPATYLLGIVAAGWAKAWGAKVRFERSVGMVVCYGAFVPGAARGGTTFGRTFISHQKDQNGNYVDPGEYLEPARYQDLMEHEFAHTRQYDLLGPVVLGIGYGVNELIANAFGAPPGCANVFERAAGLEKGGYTYCGEGNLRSLLRRKSADVN